MPSTSIKVISCCDYLTDISVGWRPVDFKTGQMVKALKGRTFKGYFETRIRGQQRRFSQENIAEFVDFIPEHMAALARRHFETTFTLVPIPNSHCTSPRQDNFRTLRLARAMGKSAGADVCAALVFKEPQTPSSKGGSRSPVFIERAMNLIAAPKHPAVLVDDVYTTGAHMRAACWKLSSAGVEVVGAITFGRSTKAPRENPLKAFVQSLGIDRTSDIADFDF